MGYGDKAEVALTTPDTDAVFEHAQRLTKPMEPDDATQEGAPHVLIPKGWTLKDLPWTSQTPKRIRQTVQLSDHPSFCRYVSDFKSEETVIFAEVSNDGGTFTAVLDYHHGEPSWCTHKAIFTPEKSENWKRWLSQNGKQMGQTEFALFLENNTPDVVTPAGADLLQIINEFEVEGSLNFQRVQRLSNGTVKFSFQNEQKAKAGDLSVPEVFTLRFPLFNGEPMTVLTARLRYRLGSGGELKVWFELVNPHVAVREGLQSLVERVATGTAIAPLMGKMVPEPKL